MRGSRKRIVTRRHSTQDSSLRHHWLTMNQFRDRQPVTRTPPALNGSPPLTPREAAPRVDATAGQECCDRCGSVRLIRVKACWRCEACGYKSDCNGW
jgi:hypothetical protein